LNDEGDWVFRLGYVAAPVVPALTGASGYLAILAAGGFYEDAPGELPQFYGLALRQLFSLRDSLCVIRTSHLDQADDMAEGVVKIEAIVSHRTRPQELCLR